MNESIFNSTNYNSITSLKPDPPNMASVSGKDRAALKKASEEFEAVFIGQLLKVMRETIEESGAESGGFGKGIYTDLFDQEIARSMAHRGALGIGDIIYKSLTEKENVYSPEAFEREYPSRQVLRSRPVDTARQGEANTNAAESAREFSGTILPVNAKVSSAFGMRNDPFTGKPKLHKGIDLSAPAGTPVNAALPGKVVSAGYESGYGNTVLVEHEGGLQTRYGHLASINVKAGDMVTSENMLGKVGSTGRSTGAHLHFEVIRQGVHVDPSTVIGQWQTVANKGKL